MRLLILVLATIMIFAAANQVDAQQDVATNGQGRKTLDVGFVPKHLQSRGSRLQSSFRKKESKSSGSSNTELAEGKAEDGAVKQAIYADGELAGGLPVEVVQDGSTGCCSMPCVPANPCIHLSPYWASVEYLHWSTEDAMSPALVTSSPAGTGQNQAGVLGRANTDILFGNGGLTDDERSGGRFVFGYWLDSCQSRGLEIRYMFLGEETESFSASSANNGILARPFFNVTTNQQDSRLIVFPNLVTGSVNVDASTEFQGAEVLIRKQTIQHCGMQIDHYFGYRYADLDDRLFITESTESVAGATAGTTFDLFDQFSTRNEFHGGELGIRILSRSNPCWTVELTGSVAFGNTNSEVSVAGQTTTRIPNGATSTVNSGLLAQSTNIGTFEDDDFATIAEFGVSLKRHIGNGMTATIGYSFLHWSDVFRAAEQIDTDINTTQIPPGNLVGDARPTVPMSFSSFHAQGIRLGLEWAY